MSTIKVDTVRPVTTDGSLTLQGDSSGSGVSGITIDSSGNVTLAGTANNVGTVTSGTFNGTIGSSASLSDGYLSGSKFDVTFYETGSADPNSEIWYKVPTACQLVDFRISAYHSTSHTAIAHVYTSAAAGTQTTQVWYRSKSSTSGWETWETDDATTSSLPVDLGGSGEHTFVGVRTTSSQSHTYWQLVTTTLTFQVD